MKQWLIREAPYKSPEQAAYLHIHVPSVAERFDKDIEESGEEAIQPSKKKKDDEEDSKDDSKESSWIFQGWRIK